MTRLEIAAVSLEDALAAKEGGAHSIEVSRDLSVGGLTPDFDLVQSILEAVQSETFLVNVLVRPHARHFIYSEAEVQRILEDIQKFVALGVDGIVFGAQTATDELDIDLICRAAITAAPLPLTLHRAIDSAAKPIEGLASLIGVVPRVLTSGPASNAWDGREGLRDWIVKFGGKMDFVASGSIQLDQIRDLLDQTGVHEIHIGGAARTADRVDPIKVRALLNALQM